ncbi:MAG: bifunctional phosphoribosylaminoimidazolecarboxamide formyltransferase/IMP cyclohydrolase, partial [Patescibacteria group bacterium]
MTKERKYALLSVFDKTGIVELANTLHKKGYLLISTGGTAKTLEQANIPIIPIHTITGNPESFDGRMKTISFQIESGILYRRDRKSHVKDAKRLGVKKIDIVVCNLYPFEQTLKNKRASHLDIVEQIDVGGPTMIRAAGKNHEHVLVVTNPDDYQSIIEKITKDTITTS